MKSKILFICLIFITQSAIAQSSFNKIIDWQFESTSIYDLIVHNDTIVGYGLGRANPEDLSTQGVIIYQADENGELLNSTIVTDTTEDFLSINFGWGKIVAAPDGGYAATTAPFYKNDAWLIKLNASLETEYIKVYEDTINLSNFAYTPFALDSGFVLYGYTQGPDGYSDGFTSLTDEDGNRQWTNDGMNNSFSNDINDVAFFNDSLLIYAGTNGLTAANDDIYRFRSILFLMNRKGEINYTWRSEAQPEIGYLIEIEVEEDGIILYGQYVAEYVWDTPLWQSTLSKISRDFSEIYWTRHFGPIKTAVSFNGLFKIVPTKDGHYIGAGAINFKPEPSAESVRYGWLYKFTSNGELMWELKVPPPASFEQGTSDIGCDFYGVGVLPDSSIVASGTIRDWTTGERFPWLVKVTNDGCLDTLCAEIQTSSLELVVEDTFLKIYPNPANRQFTIQTDIDYKFKKVNIFDVTGKLVYQKDLNVSTNKLSIDLPSTLSNNLFFVEIQTDTSSFREKIVIQN